MAIKREGILTEAQMDQEVKDTAKELAEQPKRKVKLHLPFEELSRLTKLEQAGKPVNWPYEIVGLNGHNFFIKLGKEVEVPQSIYDILAEAHLV